VTAEERNLSQMRMLIMGPPGAGKGTQAQRVADRFGVPAISTGQVFRANVAAGTPLGVEARRYMEAGEYVPDDLTNALVRDRLGEADCAAGFLLDGYPRTLEQVKLLDSILDDLGVALDLVLVLTADAARLAERLLGRAEVEGRADDTAEVIRRRQEIYLTETARLVDEYDARGILVRVDGLGTVDEVAARISGELDRLAG
jgi:adenylate kinase